MKMSLRYMARFVIVAVAANLISVSASFPLTPLVFLPEEIARFLVFQAAAPWIMWLVNVVPFPVVTAASVLYLLPVLLEIRRRGEGGLFSALAARRLLNAPLIISLMGAGGWILGTTLLISLQLYNIPDASLRGNLTTLSNALSLAGITFAFTYYALEYLNRSDFVPRYLGDKLLSDIPGVIKLSVVLRFFIFFLCAAALPVLVMTLIVVRSVVNAGETNLLPYLLVPTTMLVIGALLSTLLARSFSKPLLEMKTGVLDIQNGLLDTKIEVTTTDELGLLGEGIGRMAASIKEKEFIKETFGRVVDPAVRDHLLNGNLHLGGETRVATILFCDIRGFTTLSETLPPDQVVELLNGYFETMSVCIEGEGGLINKFIGDAIMAIYNVPVPRSDHAARAFSSARKMLQKLDVINSDRLQRGLPVIKIGIGLHTGEVLAGNIGSTSRLEYTVIGDSVNVASRIESLCKKTGHPLLLSGATAQELKGDTQLQSVGRWRLRGRAEPIHIYAAGSYETIPPD